MSLIVLIYFDEDLGADMSINVSVALTDNAGSTVVNDDGSAVFTARAVIERREDVSEPSWPVAAPLVIPVPRLKLEPHRIYHFRVSVDGRSDDSWFAAFGTDPAEE